jgi:protein-S-isoprenylcysteine O-methyltransferase Ste14
MYVAIVIVMCGVALVVGSAPFWCVPVLFALTVRKRFIPVEEANLERAFGAEYRDYRRRVRRWL